MRLSQSVNRSITEFGAPADLSQYQFSLGVSGSDCTKLVARMGDSVAEWLACWTQAQ